MAQDIKKLKERLEVLQDENRKLTELVGEEIEEDVRKTLANNEAEITVIQESIQRLENTHEDSASPSRANVSREIPSPEEISQDTSKRKSSRERTVTHKMNEYLKDELTKRIKRFECHYETLKDRLKTARTAAKEQLEEKDILSLQASIESGLEKLSSAFDDIKAVGTPPQEVRQKMDAASAMSEDLRQMLQQLLIMDNMSEKGKKYLLRQPLRGNYARSVYGSTVSRVSKWSRTSGSTDLDVERRKAEAELAAKMEEIAMDRQINIQRQKLEDLEKQREVKALEAKIRVLSCEGDDQGNKSIDLTEERPSKLCPTAEEFKPRSNSGPTANGPSAMASTQAERTMLQAITDSIQMAHLPVPTPPIFEGDPLEYVDFKTAFMDMIEDRKIQPRRKLHFLKQYVRGPARSAIAGCFYGTSEEAYEQAWKTLEKRYGRPFVVQEALGKRLENWSKIDNNDAKGLQAYADFLRTCLEAMPYVKGLSYLNDYKENKRLKAKLPYRCAVRWTRYVTEAQEDCDDFPSFAKFVDFVQKEAEVANHPISTPETVENENPAAGARRKRRPPGIALKTEGKEQAQEIPPRGNAQRPGASNDGNNNKQAAPLSPRSCKMCDSKSHRIWDCPAFKGKTVEDRVKVASDKHLCFNCLRGGHPSKECTNTSRCKTCKGRHHTLIHREDVKAEAKLTEAAEEIKDQNSEKEGISCKVHTNSNKNCTSMVVPVWVSTGSHGGEVLTYALLDTQSDCSYITEDLISKLQAPFHNVKMRLSTLTSTTSIMCKKLSNLTLRGWDQQTAVTLKSCYSREFIPCNRDHIPSRSTVKGLSHLQSIASLLPPLQDCEVGLLIGYDCPQALAPRRAITGDHDDPFAVETDLGWSVVGGQSTNEYEDGHHCHRITAKEVPFPATKDILHVLEQDFNEREVDETCHSQQDIKFLRHLENSINFDSEGHLSMSLPFKKEPDLPNNYGYAKVRLDHLKRKLNKDPVYREHYINFMEEMVEKGYAEKVSPAKDEAQVNFIPHHGVYHPQKPNKIRVVFDCSAKYRGTSLNDQLLKGPDLINTLIGVLMRFREERIALVCDIEKMFYQFNVESEDRDWLRYLWWENGDVNNSPSEFRMRVHLFGAASSPGCANYGLKFLARKFKDKYPEASKFLSRNFYVDDGLQSVESPQMAIKLINDSIELCKLGKIRLHKFLSNDREVLQCISSSERASTVSTLDLEFDDLPTERTLGINWDVAKDSFNFKVVLKDRPTTRRGILATVASIFDPLGFVAPVVLIGKQILQELCRNGSQWDDLLPESLQPRWEQWKAELQDLEGLFIPRCYKPQDMDISRVELHHFSDASQSGYGQCSYLRFIAHDGRVHCSLVMAKSRVTPTKLTTIPRLELSAAVTSVKIATLIKKELELSIDEEVYWTDSKVVLGYLANEARRFHVFVGNRVQYIRERTREEQWRYVATEENPADIASRGMSVKELLASHWLTGPKFLWEPKLPSNDIECSLALGDPEVRASVLSTKATEVQTGLLNCLSKFSRWNDMVRLIATVRRWVKGKQPILKENQEAELLILRWLQRDHFPQEIAEVRSDSVPKNSIISNLNPIIDGDGLLRVGGRLSNASLPGDSKNPVILPRDSHITKAIIQHAHGLINHQGRGQTLNELRARGYWIMGGSIAVARFIKVCVKCRKLRRSLEEQKMADLPKERVEPSLPFSHTGMDVFGPFTVKRARSLVKRYGLLFTCLSSRAVHVELLDDLTTDAFLNALRCFLALRGVVFSLHCDQGTNFIGASNELQEGLRKLDTGRMERYLAERQCEFIFNVPHASHAGGAWERQIRSIRAILNDTVAICPDRLDDSALRTLFYEASYIVNSRPLSPTNLSDPTSEPPITPNHLLHYKPNTLMAPPGKFVKEDLYGRKRWRRVQYLVEQFWCRWRREYLSSLQARNKWQKPRRNIKTGDIVLLKDDEVSRLEWPMGIVLKANPDKDGLVRKITIRVGTSQLDQSGKPVKKVSELDRPVQKVVLLLETGSD